MLETLLSEDEFRSIPESISKKLDVLLRGYVDSFKKSQAEEYEKLNSKVTQEVEKSNRISFNLNLKCKELEGIEKKLELRDRENLQLKADILRHRDEAQTYRLQRDDVMDQKSVLEGMLDRRNKELEDLKIDRDSLLEKLKAAVEAKVQALSLLDDIQSRAIELDFKEKRLDKEKELLNEQINLLSNDVSKYSKDIMNMRREQNSQVISLQTQLQHKDEEIRVLLENEDNFKKTIQSLHDRLEELNSRLTGQSEIESQLQQKYILEIESRSKLANVYKEMSEESNKKAEELSKTIKELQKLLSDASDQYKELERRFIINETTYQEHLLQKNETIAALKKELIDANHLIDSLKNDHVNETLETLSPHAAAAYNMMQKGLTLTQVYTEYAAVSEQLLMKTHDNEQLQSTFKSFIEELEGRAHILKKRNEDYAEAMTTIEKISYNYDQLETDYNVLKDKCADSDRNIAHLTRDREKLQQTISDLGRQVCFLLKEVEECRGGEIVMKHVQNDSSMDTSDFLNSSDVISKKLVTFRDIQDLQQTNQKLLNVIRDLSEEFEKVENKLKICNKEEMEEKIKRLENTVDEKTDASARQEKIIQMLKNQLKMLQMVSSDSSPEKRRRVISDNANILEVKDVEDVAIQTDSNEMERLLSAELQKELNATKRSLAELKNEYDVAKKEHSANEKTFMESIEKSEQSYQKVLQDSKKAIAQVEISQQRCKLLESSIESMKTEIRALENRAKMYSQTISNHEQTINSLREEAMNSMSALSRSEILLENSKQECALLRESEVRLRTERDILKQDKQGHAHLLSNLESIKASIERSESEWKCKMDEKLDSAVKECSALRRRLQDEQDRYAEKISLLEQNVETARSRLEDEKKSSSELMNISNSLRFDLAEKTKTMEELKEKLKMASFKSIEELELQLKNLQNKYQCAMKDIEHQKELLVSAKKDSEEMAKLSENFEKQFVVEHETHLKYKKDVEKKILTMESEMANLSKQNEALQKRVNDLSNLNRSSLVDLKNELVEEKRKNSVVVEELTSLRLQLSAAHKDLNAAVESKLLAEKKYADEMLQHTNDIKELQKQVEDIMKLKNQVASLAKERDAALLKAENVNVNWREEESQLKKEMETQSEKLNDVVQQNELLLNKIQELSLNMAVNQSQDSFNNDSVSPSEDPSQQSTDNWLQVIRFLRREKNLAISNLNALSAENMRLRSEMELAKRQLNETQTQLKAEQNKTDISNTTFVKHAELLKKVQTFSAVIDSNRVLREERDKYVAELTEMREKLEQWESQKIAPLRNENSRLATLVETLQTENTGLQNRVNFLTKEINRTWSEDVKDLKKSLNVEREAHNKTLDELRSVKQDKTKLEEQMKKFQTHPSKLAAVEKERNDLQKELLENKTKTEKISQDFGELQKTFVEQEEAISKMKSSNIQLKSIARKYKSQCQELSEQIKILKEKSSETPNPPTETISATLSEIPVVEQNRLRQEGRQQMEVEMNDRVKQLTDKLNTNQVEIDKLTAENKALQDTVAEKEVRATDILQQAKSKILHLVKAGKKHQMEAKTYKERMQTIENATREEGIARENVIKSSYENRITKLEKEKTEMQAERDRLTREVEVLSQRINTLQRQLSQPGVKTSVNSCQEKSNVEPPTANIKPMAGPSSSVTKSQQNQQSVAVTPWRSANETPLASIRPMSLQTRTAAVLPTSQTTCSASQSTVMVPPQQQLVDTSSNAPSIVEAFSSSPSSSSHTDYNMPSTSSSVSHPSVRQVVVIPTQQASHSAESTQDIEAECGNQELSSQASLSTQQQSSQLSQNGTPGLPTLSQIMTTPTVSQSQTPTVALVLPRIDLQNVPTPGSSHQSGATEQSVVASSQSTTTAPHVSASNQSDQKRTETYYQQDAEDSNLGQVSASSQHSQQQAVVASSIETAPEQSIIIASSQQSYEPSVASSNANSSNTVTTTQAGLKRAREIEGESSKSSNNTETSSAQPQVKRTRRIELVHEDLFRNEIDESGNADMLLRYSALDVEYQVPTSSQRDQEFDNLVIDSEAEDELEEDEQAMPDDGIIDENDDVQEYVEDDEVEENEEVYEMEEGYEREEQDGTMTSYNVMEGPDIDEENAQVQDQDNEVEIMDEESNEVPNQSGRTDNAAATVNRRNCEQQSSEASSSGNNLRAQSTSITSNQSSVPLQFNRRPSTISPLNRQQNQQLLLTQGFEDNTGDDSIVPSTPTLCVPRRTDGFGEAVSSPHVPSGGRFTFNESNPPPSRAAVIQMVSEGIDDTRMDLSQLEENSGTGRSVPSTPLQSSPQEVERIEVGQSVEDNQPLNEELSSNSNQNQPQPTEDVLIDNENFRGESNDNELEVTNESENLIDEPVDQGREENTDGVTSDGQSESSQPGPSQVPQDEEEEGREAEAATKGNDSKVTIPQPIPIAGNTARRSGTGRAGRSRGSRTAIWTPNSGRTRGNIDQPQDMFVDIGVRGRGAYQGRGRKPKQWYTFGPRYPM